jgi:hypothetical protein
VKRLSRDEIEEEMANFPPVLTNDELNRIRDAAQKKGAPLTNEERAAALGRVHHDDPLGLERLNVKIPQTTLR